jgi:hypothetical protein
MGLSGVSDDKAAVFVGREELLERFLRPPEERKLRAQDLVGGSGMGKSSLLRHLASVAATDDDIAVCLLDMEMFQSGFTVHRDGDDTRRVAAVKDLEALRRLSRHVVEQTSPHTMERLEAVIHAAWTPLQGLAVQNTLVARRESAVSGVRQIVKLSAGAFEVARVEKVQAAAAALSDEVARILGEVAASRILLILVDNVDAVAQSQLAAWLSDTLTILPNGVVVLAREPGQGLDLPEGLREHVRLPPLSIPEVALYLHARDVQSGGASDLAELVHQCTGGIPIAVCLLADLLADPGVGLGASDLRDRLVGAQVDPEGRIARVVAEMVERLEHRHVGIALRLASLTPECDAALMAELLRAAGVVDVDVPHVMAEVESFSFTDQYEAPDRTWYVSVHPFVARGLAQSFRRHHDEAMVRRMHQVAADHHYSRIVNGKSYGEKFVYEDPVQQASMRKWLYHLGHAEAGVRAVRCVTKIFLDAFWWWGSYVHLDFCDDLLADVRRVAEESGDRRLRALSTALTRFNERYPYRASLRRSFAHAYPPGVDWEGVRDALLAVADVCALDLLPDEPTDEERTLAALHEIFLAHTYRYAAEDDVRDPGEAVACYGRAAAHLAAVGETWDQAWVVFERADVLMESGDLEGALEGSAEAARILAAATEGGEPDEELIANLHRLRADCAWARDDRATAMRESGSAVLHAYLFHRIGGPPDDYTMQYYFEQRGRALDRLLEIASEDPEAALVAATQLSEAVPAGVRWPRPDPVDLAPLLFVRSLPVLAEALFPRGPEVAELASEDSAFLTELRRVHHDLRGRLRDDLWGTGSSRSGDGPSQS